MTDDKTQCRWHNPGRRCPIPQAFPGMADVPPFCLEHLATLEPWIAARAAQRGADASEWIAWARRQAETAEHTRIQTGDPPVFQGQHTRLTAFQGQHPRLPNPGKQPPFTEPRGNTLRSPNP
jgi:hypothetical protein